MSRLPCEQRRIIQPHKDADCRDYVVLPSQCAAPHCERQAAEEHHAVPRWFTRSWWTRDWAVIDGVLVTTKVPLCRFCHARCTENNARIVWMGGAFNGWAWKDENGPTPRPVTAWTIRLRKPGAPVGNSAVTSSAPASTTDAPPGDLVPPPPGTTCNTCGRKVPHTKKPTSPKSKTIGTAVPVDAVDSFKEQLVAWEEALGCSKEPYAAYKATLTALAYCNQNAEAIKREIGKRVA